jgi:glycosyltransferase involved in cell wall biosynthesis
MRKEYEKRSGRKIEVIPPLIPFRKWTVSKSKTKEKYGFEKDQTIILSLGSLRKVKGSDILLNAFFLLEKEYIEKNKIRLIYVGDGILRKDLEERVQREGFGEHVKFFGNISYDKVPEIFELADIYVIASLFEGTPLSLLEAMFNGLPIIGASADGIANLISDNENGLIFEKNNEKSLMEKIKKLLEERELATQLGKRAQEKFEEYFRYEKVVEDHVQIYERIARKI